MNKVVMSNNIIKKIAIIMLIILCFNFIMPKQTNAAWYDNLGGTLGKNIGEFVTFLGDLSFIVLQYGVTGEWNEIILENAGEIDGGDPKRWRNSKKIDLPNIKMTPDTIFEGKIALFGINFIEPIKTKYTDVDGQEKDLIGIEKNKNALEELRNIIAKWYVSIRNLALVAMLSILVYIGIRVMLASTAKDKAKYKSMIMDWVVGLCLVLVLHYIMLATIKITEKLTDMLTLEPERISLMEGDKILTNGMVQGDIMKEIAAETMKNNGCQNYYMTTTSGNKLMFDLYYGRDVVSSVSHVEYDINTDGIYLSSSDLDIIYVWKNNSDTYTMKINAYQSWSKYWSISYENTIRDGDFHLEYLRKNEVDMTDKIQNDARMKGNEYKASNLVEYTRLYTELKKGSQHATFVIIYFVLAAMTFMFGITYMKRTVYMIFLTLMAPLVSITYALDRINDGKSQAFDMWLKEFIFNALIQPVHLLLYIILVGSALDLASTSLIYAIVALGFILSAEKLVRRFFRMDKATTLGGIGDMIAGGAIMSMFKNIPKPKLSGSGKKGKGESEGDESDDKNKIRYHNNEESNPYEGIGSGGSSDDNSDSETKEAEKEKVIENEQTDKELDTDAQQNQDTTKATQDEEKQNKELDTETAQDSNTNTENKNTEEKQKITGWQRIKDSKAVKRLGLIGYGAGTGAKRFFRKGGVGRRLGKGLLKTGAGMTMSAAAATTGLAVGVATGDMNKAIKYGGAGLVGGMHAGANAIESASSIVGKGIDTVKGVPDKIQEGWNNIKDGAHQGSDTPEEYKEYLKEKQERVRSDDMEKFRKQEKDKKVLSGTFGKDKADKIMQNEVLTKYFDANMTDHKEIAAAEKTKDRIMERDNLSEERARQEAIRAIKIDEALEKKNLNKSKDREQEIVNQMKNQEIQESAAMNATKNILGDIDYYKNIKDSL